MILLTLRCDLCPTSTAFPNTRSATKAREAAKRDGWKSGRLFLDQTVKDLCPVHAERYEQLAERERA